ncbi:MAG: hypothetical protein RhofKO_16660 [Rhodothermales bacterium]
MRAFLWIALLFITAAPLHAQSLFSDFKAHNVGDVITIRLAERTSAQRASGWDNQSSANTSGNGSVNGGTLNGTFGVNSQFAADASNTNSSVQSDLLRGIMTARIVNVDSTGSLVIEGTRSLNVNGETHKMQVQGFARARDITRDNTIFSYQLADATIIYKRDGFGKRRFKPGFFARAAGVALLGAAVLFAAQ